MTLQHLQPGVAQPAERQSRVGVIGITIGASDLGGSLLFLSLALTNFLPKLLVFFRLIQGLGIWFSCSTVVFRLFLIVFKSSLWCSLILEMCHMGMVVYFSVLRWLLCC